MMHSFGTLAAGAAVDATVARDLLLILAAAGIVSLLFHRLRMAAIPGYLIAGILLGAFVQPGESVQSISQLAVVLLMFGIGLHLDLDSFRRGAAAIVGAGVISTALSTVLLTPAGMAFGLSLPVALGVGMALSLSSTAVVMRLLQQRRELTRTHGRIAFGVLLVQDMAVIAMLALVPTIAAWAASASGQAAAESTRGVWGMIGRALVSVGAIGVFVFVMRRVLPGLCAAAARASTEALLVLASATALSAALVTGSMGLSPELGAFIAGFVLARTPFRYQLSSQLSPLRDLFMAVFFTAVGMGADLSVMAEQWWVVLVATGAVLAIKFVSISVSCWAVGGSGATALRVGMGLAQAGEFSLVMLGALVAAEVLEPTPRAVIIGVVIVSLIVTPALLDLSTRLARAKRLGVPAAPWVRSSALLDPADIPERVRQMEAERGEDASPAIIVGFGPVGRAVAERFDKLGQPFVIIELNPQTVKRQQQLGRRAVFGDATSPEVLESAGAEGACAIVVTIPDDDSMLRVCKSVRTMAPDACIVARASVASAGMLARLIGVQHVVVEEIATAESMAGRVMSELEAMGRGRAAEAGDASDTEPPQEATESGS
ncbi:MAG: cation:proton antiporter [Phycisphaerales bacterium JB037]